MMASPQLGQQPPSSRRRANRLQLSQRRCPASRSPQPGIRRRRWRFGRRLRAVVAGRVWWRCDGPYRRPAGNAASTNGGPVRWASGCRGPGRLPSRSRHATGTQAPRVTWCSARPGARRASRVRRGSARRWGGSSRVRRSRSPTAVMVNPRQPVEARFQDGPDQRRAGVLAGEPADDLHATEESVLMNLAWAVT